MPRCEHCGKAFDVDDARNEFEMDDEMARAGMTYDSAIDTYDEGTEEHTTCGPCALALSLESLEAGRAYLFSLETGLPPDDAPEELDSSARLSFRLPVLVPSGARDGYPCRRGVRISMDSCSPC